VIRNLIFDFDGTLTDSRRDIAGTQLLVLRELGVTTVSEADLYPYVGKTLEETFQRVLPAHLHPLVEDAAKRYSAVYPSRALRTTTLFPGVRETLQLLHKCGHGLAVASTKKGPGILRATDHFGITSLFDQLQGSEDLPYKPDPAIVHKIMRDRGWDYGETMMVGDTDNDVLAGRRAGVATCGVTYGALSRDQLMALQPDFLIDHFPDLLRVLDNRASAVGS
jgi:phosphoglycolate phosphatase